MILLLPVKFYNKKSKEYSYNHYALLNIMLIPQFIYKKIRKHGSLLVLIVDFASLSVRFALNVFANIKIRLDLREKQNQVVFLRGEKFIFSRQY